MIPNTTSSPLPVNILLDTDMATDCDDAGAIAVLHALATSGEARILGIAVNNKDANSVGAVAAINAYYQRPDIPLGAYKEDHIGTTAGEFVRALATDTASYGHSICSRNQACDALTLYRSKLMEMPDQSVVIVSIGHLNNLYDLLHSDGDEECPLSGLEIIQRKVSHAVIMGGDYPRGKEYNFYAHGAHSVSAEVLEQWPTNIVFTGYSLGLNIKTGPGLSKLPEEHPVRRAYAMYPSNPLYRGRPSWDQTAVYAAVRGPERLWELSPPGEVCVASDGSNTWTDTPSGRHRYMIEKTSPSIVSDTIEKLMMSQPRSSTSAEG